MEITAFLEKKETSMSNFGSSTIKINCYPKGNLNYDNFPNQIIVVRKGKEINWDSVSNGEWKQTSLYTFI